MITMYGPFTTSAATGGAGAAAGTITTTEYVRGKVLGVYIQYNDSPPAGTTDVGISAQGETGVLPTINILTISNAATSGYFAPRSGAVTNAGAAITDSYEPFVVNHKVKIDIAQANDGDSVSVWFFLER